VGLGPGYISATLTTATGNYKFKLVFPQSESYFQVIYLVFPEQTALLATLRLVILMHIIYSRYIYNRKLASFAEINTR
jgi:hypothetical protein